MRVSSICCANRTLSRGERWSAISIKVRSTSRSAASNSGSSAPTIARSCSRDGAVVLTFFRLPLAGATRAGSPKRKTPRISAWRFLRSCTEKYFATRCLHRGICETVPKIRTATRRDVEVDTDLFRRRACGRYPLAALPRLEMDRRQATILPADDHPGSTVAALCRALINPHDSSGSPNLVALARPVVRERPLDHDPGVI